MIDRPINLDGFEFIGRRVGLAVYYKAGMLPQALLNAWMQGAEGEDSEFRPSKLTTDELKLLIEFQRELVCTTVVKPEIVTHNGPLEAGQLRYSDVVIMEPKLPDLILNWVIEGCPGVPVPLGEGKEATVEAVTRFHQKQPGGKPAIAGADGAEVRNAAESLAGD